MALLNVAERGGKSVCCSQTGFEGRIFLARHGGWLGAERWPRLGDTSVHGRFLHLGKAEGPGGCLGHPCRLTWLLGALSLILASDCPGCLLPAYVGTREVCDLENGSCEEELEELHA